MAENKVSFLKKQIPVSDLKTGMYFAGFLGVPEHFKTLKEKQIDFLRKYRLVDIKVYRNNQELMLTAQEIQPEDKIISLGRLDKYLKIGDGEKTKKYLAFFGFNNVYILEKIENPQARPQTTDRPKPTIQPVSVPTVKKTRQQETKDSIETLHAGIEKSESIQERGQEIIHDIFLSGNFQNFKLETIEEVARGIDETLTTNPASYNALTMLKDHDEYTFRHCVDVANQMMMTLKYMRRENVYNMKDIGVAAMLHDIGKSKIPLEIINKPGRLNEQEWEYMRMHPVYSAEIMKIMGLSKMQIDIGYKHHVKKNGTGYPQEVSYEETSEIDRLCTVSDVYQALITKRPYKLTDTPIQAFKKLKQWMTTDFDETIVEIFIKAFGIFPPGSMVKLIDGRCAFVLIRGKDTLRPVIAVVINNDRSLIDTPEIIDLENPDFSELRILEGTNHRNYFKDNEAYEIFQRLS